MNLLLLLCLGCIVIYVLYKGKCLKRGQRVRNSSLRVIVFFSGLNFGLQKLLYLLCNTPVATTVLCPNTLMQ